MFFAFITHLSQNLKVDLSIAGITLVSYAAGSYLKKSNVSSPPTPTTTSDPTVNVSLNPEGSFTPSATEQISITNIKTVTSGFIKYTANSLLAGIQQLTRLPFWLLQSQLKPD
jgi:hypothetical protein